MSAFRTAFAGADIAALEQILHPEVRFCSPAVHTPYAGREVTLVVLDAVTSVMEAFAYVDEWVEPGRELLRFTASIDGLQLEGVDLLEIDADGLVTDLTVMIRPLRGLERLTRRVSEALESGEGR
ncbi:MAG: nuclear transport factor 2 family protein [Nocardioides sp.]|jgi:hypothetical protein